VISLQALRKVFGGVVSVDDLTLSIAEGETVALVGDSGSGKTTTLRMINRLVEPTSGRVVIGGVDAASMPRHELRRRIGYVFQKGGLFPHWTVRENIAAPLRVQGRTQHLDAAVRDAARGAELDEGLLDRYPSALSGGQQQRAGVARALSTRPALLLLDEPFGALDPLTRDRIQATFVSLRRERGLTAVFVTHDLAEAMIVADRIAVMRAGRIVQVGPAAELVQRPADDEVRRLLDTPRRDAEVYAALRGQPRA
jgi:osmoprotectant transport system ATP-binding protein